jgi:hypothetical protein
MMRNTPPADGDHPQQPPVTTRGDRRLNFKFLISSQKEKVWLSKKKGEAAFGWFRQCFYAASPLPVAVISSGFFVLRQPLLPFIEMELILRSYFPATISSSICVVNDFGRSIGCPSARAHTALAVTPSNRLTPNRTV